MSYHPGQNYQFRYTLAVALLIHGLIIFGITVGGVVAQQTLTQNNALEVVVSILPSETTPEESDFQASQNQLASGSGEQEQELTTTQQALLPDDTVNRSNPLVLLSSQPPLVEESPYRIITTSSNTSWHIQSTDKDAEKSPDNAENPFEQQTLSELSLSIASLEARLAESLQPESKKPRTLRITSTSALASDNADYVRRWRDRVEEVGNLYYPQVARDKQLYGDVRLLVAILSSGIVEQISIRSSSGQDILDKAAIESIQLASPFEPFPPSLAAQYERIEVIRTWQFRKDRVTAKALQ